MARAPRFRIAQLGELLRQIAFASPDARRRQLHAAEILLDEIDPRQTYRADLVAHRITGFRPERSASDALLVGEALVADLSTFGVRLSEGLGLAPDDRPGGALTLDELSRRMRVTPRTIHRWRQLGLPLHWVEFRSGRSLGCYVAALEAFLRRHPELRRRPSPVRMQEEEQAALIAEARSIREATGGTLSAVAEVLAHRRGRAHETIRQLLLRHDARSERPVFIGQPRDRAPIDDRDRRFIERAWRAGVPLGRIAAHLHRSLPAVHRQLMIRRRERLSGLRLRWIELPTFALPEADQIILASPAARQGLRRLTTEVEALRLIESLRLRVTAEADVLLAAWNFLKRRAAGQLSAVTPASTARAIDAIERDLRWAALVQQTLLALALSEAIRRVDLWLGRRLESLASEEIRELLVAVTGVCVRTIDRADPGRGYRLDRLVALDVHKALARRGGPPGVLLRDGVLQPRAGAAHAQRTLSIRGLFETLSLWQAWLDPPPRWPQRLGELPPAQRTAVTALHGLADHAPMTTEEVARVLRVSRAAAARIIAQGDASLRRGAAGSV
jgi:hypothetical protein